MPVRFLFATVSALLLLCAPAIALPGASAQVDGITQRVADHLWNQADEEWHQGDYPRIIALDRIIAEADPHFLESYAVGGWLLESLGQHGDAEAFYQQGIRANPRASYAYYNLGFFYFNTRHDYAHAANVFRGDVAQRDADLNDWKMLAHSYEHLGDWNRAVQTWRAMKSRWPNGLNVDRLLQRALAHQKMLQSDQKMTAP